MPTRPLVVLLDNCHWADEASLELVTHVIGIPALHSIAFVLSYRPLKSSSSAPQTEGTSGSGGNSGGAGDSAGSSGGGSGDNTTLSEDVAAAAVARVSVSVASTGTTSAASKWRGSDTGASGDALSDDTSSQQHALARLEALVAVLHASPLLRSRLLLVPVSQLEVSAVVSIVSECCPMPMTLASELGTIVHERAGGNPYFVMRYLSYLTTHDPALLYFDDRRGVWSASLETVRSDVHRAENVITLVRDNLASLPESTRQMLRIAAFVGICFELATLRQLVPPSADVLADIDVALQGAFIVPAGKDRFTFAHERIMLSCAGFASGESVSKAYLRVARVFYARWYDEHGGAAYLAREASIHRDDVDDIAAVVVEPVRDDDADNDDGSAAAVATAAHETSLSELFVVATYYERGLAAIDDDDERARVAQLLWHVACASYRASAFDVALRHATSVKALTTDTDAARRAHRVASEARDANGHAKQSRQERFVAEYRVSTFARRWALLVMLARCKNALSRRGALDELHWLALCADTEQQHFDAALVLTAHHIGAGDNSAALAAALAPLCRFGVLPASLTVVRDRTNSADAGAGGSGNSSGGSGVSSGGSGVSNGSDDAESPIARLVRTLPTEDDEIMALVTAPESVDRLEQRRLTVLANALAPALSVSSTLWRQLAVEFVLRCIAVGGSDLLCVALSWAAALLLTSDHERLSLAYGEAAMALLPRYPRSTFRGQALAVWGMLVAWRTRTHRAYVQLTEHAFRVCVECGDIVYASYCVLNFAWSRFAASPTLGAYLSDMETWLTFSIASQLTPLTPQCLMMMQVARALLGRTDECSLDTVGADVVPFVEADYLRDFGGSSQNMAPFYIFKVVQAGFRLHTIRFKKKRHVFIQGDALLLARALQRRVASARVGRAPSRRRARPHD